MYYGLEAFRKYIQIYPTPYDDTDIGIIDSILEGEISLDDEGKLHLTDFSDVQGEA
jgi:hypothetical protein